MRKFGLIGYPLGHSFSKKYFAEKFTGEGLNDCSYENFPLRKIEDISALIDADPEICGLNVTIPYKTEVTRFLSEVSTEAEAIGAVNVIKVVSRGGTRKLTGFNSDAFAFRESILPFISDSSVNALVLGTGGASRAVEYIFKQLGIGYHRVSRSKKPGCITYMDLNRDAIENHEIIVNTTPAGMFPDTGSFPPIPYEYLSPRNLLYDLVYNPEVTVFMRKGKNMGCTVTGGLRMLHLQAEKSWQIWNDQTIR
ncbi:MAG TPA: hypothetical protein VMT63_14475 [Bacteroidales bacterium]|nr:hypothetical protein [Bacteroidales bacterium]